MVLGAMTVSRLFYDMLCEHEAWQICFVSCTTLFLQFIKLNELFREAKFQEDHGMTSAEAAKHGGGHGGGH